MSDNKTNYNNQNSEEEIEKSSPEIKVGKKKKISKKKENKLNELQEKYDGLNDKYLRLFSEFDNFRKRTIKEKIDLSKTASKQLIVSLLPVLDDFERAIKSLDESDDIQSFREGIMLIYNKFKKTLESQGLEKIEAHEHEFDTDHHEAITSIPAPSEDLIGKVVDVVENGYKLNGKVIRYAKVVVGK